MRNQNKISAFFLFFLQFVNSQGIHNSFNIGSLEQMKGSQAVEYGILPNFRYDISLYNPATWPKLKFTQLSLNYKGIENSSDVKNIISGISSAKMIIPFKNNNAIGISFNPYSDQNIIYNDSLVTTNLLFGDTIQTSREYTRQGGLFSFQTGFGRFVNNKISFGLNLNYVFGSSRDSEIFVINQIPTISKNRYKHSGVFFQGFTNFYPNNKTGIFFSIKHPFKNLRTVFERYHLFEDINENGYHDNYGDFPNLSDVNLPKLTDLNQVIHSPKEIIIGFERKIFNKIVLNTQVSRYEDNGERNKNYNNEINRIIRSSNSLSIGLMKFSNQLSSSFYNKFIIRLGLDYKNARISSEIPMAEFGYSLGISFKFNTLSNQIDFNYSGGQRAYDSNYEKETFQQLSIGITIADLWFVKRRQRRNE